VDEFSLGLGWLPSGTGFCLVGNFCHSGLVVLFEIIKAGLAQEYYRSHAFHRDIHCSLVGFCSCLAAQRFFFSIMSLIDVVVAIRFHFSRRGFREPVIAVIVHGDQPLRGNWPDARLWLP
jgi:hypothetical protein